MANLRKIENVILKIDSAAENFACNKFGKQNTSVDVSQLWEHFEVVNNLSFIWSYKKDEARQVLLKGFTAKVTDLGRASTFAFANK